jgi:hypothetical protein
MYADNDMHYQPTLRRCLYCNSTAHALTNTTSDRMRGGAGPLRAVSFWLDVHAYHDLYDGDPMRWRLHCYTYPAAALHWPYVDAVLGGWDDRLQDGLDLHAYYDVCDGTTLWWCVYCYCCAAGLGWL